MSTYTLSRQSIGQLCEDMEQFYESERVAKRESIRLCLLAEEALLKYRDAFGEDYAVEMRTASRFTKASIQLTVFCPKLDPFSSSDGDEGIMKSLIAASAQQNPVWKYIRSSSSWLYSTTSRNELIFSAPRQGKLSNPAKILLCLACGLLLAFLTRLFLTPDQCSVFASNYILPIADAYTGLLSVMAILLVFFSIPLCIVQYGSAATFSNVTRRVVMRFILISAVFVLVAALFIVPFLGFDSGTAVNNSGLAKSVLDILLGFVPKNLVAPFVSFNCMQVIIIGLIFGFAFIAMGDESRSLVSSFDRCNFIAVLTNNYLSRFVHLYVGLMAYYFVLTDRMSFIAEVVWVIVAVCAGCILALVFFTLRVHSKFKVPCLLLAKKLLPSFIINLSSANTGASGMVLTDELVRNCGVEINYVGMSSNLGSILFKPMYNIFLAAAGLIAAGTMDCLSPVVMLQIILMSFVLPAAIPGIQGGAASVILLMVSQLGLGSSVAEVIISVNSLLQFLIVPVNMYCMECIVILTAAKDNGLNKDILLDPKKVSK